MVTTLLFLAAVSAPDVLDRSIQYHDPEGRFFNTPIRLELSETRPNGPPRKTTVTFDNARGRFEMERQVDGRQVDILIEGNRIETFLDGSSTFSPEESRQYRLAPDQALRTRNYYLYLYGLPMKLGDPGTRLEPEAKLTRFQEKPAYELRVTYDEDVGSDTWYFYFDPESYALIGYRFYHDESRNDGEYIVLEGEAEGAGLRLPAKRSWYRHEDDAYLGTDTIVSIQKPRRAASR